MKRKFLRTLVFVLTAFAAVSVLVCTDEFKEFEVGYIQGEMLKTSAEGLTARPDRQVVYPTLAAVSGRSQYPHGSAALTKSSALVCLSTCVLLC